MGAGSGLLALLTLPWLLTVVTRGGRGFSEHMLWDHVMVRFFKGFHHLDPYYHYVVRFLEEFAPWSEGAST